MVLEPHPQSNLESDAVATKRTRRCGDLLSIKANWCVDQKALAELTVYRHTFEGGTKNPWNEGFRPGSTNIPCLWLISAVRLLPW